MSLELNFNNLKKSKMHLSPQRSRYGRIIPHSAEVIEINNKLFKEKVIVMSDLHESSMLGIQKLEKIVKLEDYIVITAGDMSGTGIRGEDGYPYKVYQYLCDRANLFYFVQGNHDLPEYDNEELNLKNTDGSSCFLYDSVIYSTPIGCISGVNGTISRKPHPYKSPPEIYLKKCEQALKKSPSIFITHETPRLKFNQITLNGDKELFSLVCKYKPKIHIYGHCHHYTPFKLLNGVLFINVDSRILIFNPEEEN